MTVQVAGHQVEQRVRRVDRRDPADDVGNDPQPVAPTATRRRRRRRGLDGVLSYLLVRTSLRPLRRVEETAHAIADGDLDETRPPASSPHPRWGTSPRPSTRCWSDPAHSPLPGLRKRRALRGEDATIRRRRQHELRTPLTSIKGLRRAVPAGRGHRRRRRVPSLSTMRRPG